MSTLGKYSLWGALAIGAAGPVWVMADVISTPHECAWGRNVDHDVTDVHGETHRLNEYACMTCAAGHEAVCLACKHWTYDGLGWRCAR